MERFKINIIILIIISYSCKSQNLSENQKLIKISDTVLKLEEYYENGKLQTEIYMDKDAQPHGKTIIYDSLGNKKSEFNNFHGERHGKQLSYYDNGTIESEDNFLNGVQDGDEFLKNKEGKIIFHRVYRNGIITHKYFIRDEITFKNDVNKFIKIGKDSLEAIKLANDIVRDDSLKTIEFNNSR